MSKILKWSLWGLLGILVIAQFIRPKQENPPVVAAEDFLSIAQPPADVASVLQSACYDCHSHETTYPWYANITPINWWLYDHIEEGREHLNFSIWGTYEPRRADHKLEEIVEVVDEGEMPLQSYTWTHADARLSAEQRSMLTAWASDVRLSLRNANASVQESTPAMEEQGEQGEEEH